MRADVANDAANSAVAVIIKEGVMGALLVVSVALLVFLVRRVLAVQDMRVEDQKKMSDRLERSQERQSALIEKMTQAFTSFESAVDKMNQTQQLSSASVTALLAEVGKLQSTVDSVVRDAVRKPTSRTGAYSVVRPEETKDR